MNLYQFLLDLPWLAALFAYLLVKALGWVIKLLCRALRTINIALRGWPPPHLDADGDFRPDADES